ncbi:MAG: ABC transporter permease subunit [Treponema sp.]|nr:ABC transporter permease subunit [Treponema sp.]
MKAILKREFFAYFYTPLGYVFIAAYYLFTGFFFFNYNLYGNSSDMRSLFNVLFTITLFLIPLLTMRLMSEDRKMKTDQLLLMSPQSSAGIITGKYIAALCVYLLGLSGVLAASAVIAAVGSPEWPVIAGNFTGLFLLGSALIAIGLYISALTENQIIAAIGGYCVGFFLMLFDGIAAIMSGSAPGSLLKALSVRTRYELFTMGILRTDNIVFFASLSFFFVFLTINHFEKRRWA